MNHDISNPKPHATAHPMVPIWVISLTVTLIFLAGVYFDHHSGWFDARVYGPYANAEQVQMYQPLAGAEAERLHGKQVYDAVCGTCHGADGMGMAGKAPPLAGSEWVLTKGFKRLTEIPLAGLNGPVTVKGQSWNASMAAMGAGLNDKDLAAVLTYIRSSWGNKAEPVEADDVKAIRAELAGHAMINGETELKTIPE